MQTVLLVIHLMICAALVAVVLMQRSEGGALGIGGGGGGMMTGRGTANLLTRITTFLAAAFFATSIALALLAKRPTTPAGSIVNPISAPASEGGSTTGGGSTLPPLEPLTPPSTQPAAPSVPQSQ